MWMKLIGAAIGLLGWSVLATAQFPNQFGQQGYGGGFPQGGSGGAFMPNIYNPQSQPLSPYLNMSRGGDNPAANYYFGTRPGTVGGGGGFGGAPNIAMGGNRGLFPFQITPEELQRTQAICASYLELAQRYARNAFPPPWTR